MLLRAEHVPMHVRFMLGIMNAASHGCVPKLDAMRSDEHMARHMRDQPVVTQRQRVLLLALGWPWGAWSEVHAVKHHQLHAWKLLPCLCLRRSHLLFSQEHSRKDQIIIFCVPLVPVSTLPGPPSACACWQ